MKATQCAYCERPTFKNAALPIPANAISRDHRLPKSRGGGNIPNNRIYTCHACNMAKSDMTADEFLYFRSTGRFASTYIVWLEARHTKIMKG